MEPKPLFVNTTQMDETTCRDFLALSWGKNAGRIRIVLLTICLISAVYGGMQLFYNQKITGYVIGFFAISLLALAVGQWGWMLRLPSYTASQRQAWKAPTLSKTVSFYSDKFVQTSPLGQLVFYYNNITGIRQNNRSMVIYMGSNALLVSRLGFGSTQQQAGFIKFINKAVAEGRTAKRGKK